MTPEDETDWAVPDRKSEIREAALTLMSERGYHGTSMEEIARLVDVRASSLYNHITSKQSVLVDIMVTSMQEALSEFALATAVDRPELQLRNAVEAHVRYNALHPREARIGGRETPNLEEPSRSYVVGLRDDFERGWQRLIQQGVDEGAFETLSARLSAYALIEMGAGVAQWYRPHGSLSLTEIMHHYSQMALRLVGYENRRSGLQMMN